MFFTPALYPPFDIQELSGAFTRHEKLDFSCRDKKAQIERTTITNPRGGAKWT
jgi:hypothetical protein